MPPTSDPATDLLPHEIAGPVWYLPYPLPVMIGAGVIILLLLSVGIWALLRWRRHRARRILTAREKALAALDVDTFLFSPEGEMLSQAETIPAQLGIMSTAIRYMFAKIPRDQWKPGDIIVCNDPYQGCTHTPDVCLFSPVFHDGELIALTSTIAHHVDIGGKVPGSEGPDNMEVFAEGLILPPLKLIEEGRPNQAIFDILAANVRDPRGSAGVVHRTSPPAGALLNTPRSSSPRSRRAGTAAG